MSLLLLSSTLFLFLHFSSSLPTCHITTCGPFGPDIKFPFGLTGSFCNFPRFNLSCNSQHQTILTLKNTPGFFTVQTIFYQNQSLVVRDPDNCLPKRFLNHSFSLNDSPFYPEFSRTFTFLSCRSFPENFPDSRLVPCMSNENKTVVAVLDGSFGAMMAPGLGCEVIERSVAFPVAWRRGDAETRLSWSEPSCGSCERRGGICGFDGDPSSLRVGCSGLSRSGLPRSAKYGIVIGAGIPGLLCIIGIGCYLSGRIRDYYRGRNQQSIDFNTTIVPHRSIVLTGFDGPTIESFPKTQLGDSGRLPKPNDTTCPICLSEYQAKETIRTIPECNHYFHADCVDEWLKLNASCPLCRNSPEGPSAMTTPSLSSLSSSSSLSAR